MSEQQVRPSAIDPPEVEESLWDGWTGDLAFDVGANAGQSVPHLLNSFQRVICFEPCHESWDLLRQGFAHDPRVTIRAVAVSGHEGTIELATVPLPMETGQLVTPGTMGMEWEPPDWDVIPKRLIPSVTLDKMARTFGRPDFVKVDTEGHEVFVLQGATEVLSLARTGWLVEFHSPDNKEECQDILVQAGLRVRVVRHPHYTLGGRMWHQHGWLRAVPADW